MAPAEAPATFCVWYPRPSRTEYAPTSAMPFTPPPWKTRSALRTGAVVLSFIALLPDVDRQVACSASPLPWPDEATMPVSISIRAAGVGSSQVLHVLLRRLAPSLLGLDDAAEVDLAAALPRRGLRVPAGAGVGFTSLCFERSRVKESCTVTGPSRQDSCPLGTATYSPRID